jgi:hypothetical protein
MKSTSKELYSLVLGGWRLVWVTNMWFYVGNTGHWWPCSLELDRFLSKHGVDNAAILPTAL